MLWFTVWTVLVVATLAGGFFLVRHVYRSARALVRELERAADAVGRLGEQVEEVAASLDLAAVRPVTVADRAAAREHRASLAGVRARREQRRLDRHAGAFRRWLSFSR